MTVNSKVVEDPKGKGRHFAAVLDRPELVGNILNAGDVPGDQKEIGTELDLEIASVNDAVRQISFRYPKK